MAWRRARGGGVTLLVSVLVAILVPLTAPLAGQPLPSLRQLETQYNSAVLDYEAALGAATSQQQLWEDMVIALDPARRTGGEEASAAALQELEDVSLELQRLTDRVSEARETAEGARLALLDGLDRERRDLEAEYASATTAAQGRRIDDRLQGIMAQVRNLENEPLAPATLPPLYSSIIQDPRDLPPLLRLKIQLLERRIQVADSTLGEVDHRIEGLLERQRIQQTAEDFLSGLVRFDADRLPTGPPAPTTPREEGVPADSTALQEAVPLPQQIAEARLLREHLVDFRDELARRVGAMREQLRRITE